MVQQSALDVYAWLDEWADGDLANLAHRMVDAPWGQAEAMVRKWPDQDHHLGRIAPGQLRPMISVRHGETEMVNTALQLLLYADEVVVDPVVLNPYSLRQEDPAFDPRELSTYLERIAALRPLIDSGALLVGDERFASRGRHPARLGTYVNALAAIQESEGAGGVLAPFDPVELEFLAPTLAGVLSTIQHGRATPLALDAGEGLLMKYVLAGHQVDGRLTALETLARIAVPSVSAASTSLVKLRSESGALASFRDRLRASLVDVARVPEGAGAIEEARAIVRDGLERSFPAIEAEAKSSLWKPLRRQGVRAITFTGIATTAGLSFGAAAGVPAMGGVIGGAAGLVRDAAEAIGSSIALKQQRDETRAIWGVITGFFPGD
jgi:hypothetical protein